MQRAMGTLTRLSKLWIECRLEDGGALMPSPESVEVAVMISGRGNDQMTVQYCEFISMQNTIQGQ